MGAFSLCVRLKVRDPECYRLPLCKVNQWLELLLTAGCGHAQYVPYWHLGAAS